METILALVLALWTGTGAAAECPPANLPDFNLPRTRAALASNVQVVVVAFGSSSTQSWMATDAAHSYPAVLQAALNAALPRAHVAVINRGIGGQDAAEELSRLEADVVAVRPQLVIWQVGANGAMRAVDPLLFRRLVEAGVTRLKAVGEDVILMDNQRAPRILAAPDHAALERMLAEISRQMQVNLFQRGTLMDQWQQAGMPYAAFISSDRLHMNNRGYDCTARALAAAIVSGVRKVPVPAGDGGRGG
ncbi:MAG TPA: SGNH/GDSL hydrolase family protein [Acetobacteraceae bacterium]|nr:SGNH/GDSL hydrolase family protein [Acetobacteraceae bacterium]